jgi:hypothetical protein
MVFFLVLATFTKRGVTNFCEILNAHHKASFAKNATILFKNKKEEKELPQILPQRICHHKVPITFEEMKDLEKCHEIVVFIFK